MTIASLIVDVAANTGKLVTDVEQIHGSMNRIEGMAAKVKTAIAGAFTVTAVVAAGKQVLDYADALSNMSAKTGISTSGLQKLDLAFKQSGISLDTVTRATTELANRIVGGDKSTLAALGKLGLSADSLKRMSLEEMFITVGDAVGQMGNKAEQVYASKTLFGKSGVELLAGLTGHLKETTAEFERMGLIIDEETIAAADKFGDRLGLMGHQLLGVVAAIVGPLLPALSALMEILAPIGKLAGDVVGFAIKGLSLSIMGLWAAIAELLGWLVDLAQRIPFVGEKLGFLTQASEWLHNSAAKTTANIERLALGTTSVSTSAAAAVAPVVGLGKAAEDTAKAAEKAAQKQAAWNESIRAANVPYQSFLRTTAMLAPAIEDNAASLDAYDLIAMASVEDTGRLAQETRQAAYELRRMGMALDFTAHQANNASLEIAHAEGVWRSFVGGVTEGISAIWSGMTGDRGLTGLFRNLGSGIMEGFGQIISGGITSLMNSAISLAMKGLGKLWGWVKGMFGPSADEREARRVFDTWVAGVELTAEQIEEVQHAVSNGWQEHLAIAAIAIRDAYLATGHSAEEATAVTQRLFDATRVSGAAVQAVLREIEVVMRDAYEKSAQTASDTATAGFEKTDRAIQDTITTLKGLTNEEYEKLKARSIEILTLVHGLWTEAHNATLAAKNAVWAVIDAVLNLAAQAAAALASVHQALTNVHDAALATANAVDQIPRDVTVHVNYVASGVPSSFRDGGGDGGGDYDEDSGTTRAQRTIDGHYYTPQEYRERFGFQHGTGGRFLDFGAGTPVVLHGRERVMTEAEGRAEGSAFAVLADEFRRWRHDQPRATAIAVRDALVLAGVA